MSKSDSFEAAMWPILNILRLSGFFPVIRRGRKLEFSLVWLFINVFTLLVIYGPALVLIYRGLQMIPNQEPNSQLFSYVFMIGLSSFISLSFLALLRTFPHIKFCDNIHNFKESLTQISAYSSLQFDQVRRWTVVCPLFLILPFIGNMVVTPALGHRLPNLALDFYLALISSEMIVMLVWWRGTMQAISDCSRALLDSYKNITLGLVPDSEADRILAFRSLWLSLCDLLRDAGNVFPLTYIGLTFLNVFICSHSLYELLALPEIAAVLHFIFFLSLPLMALTIICVHPQRATTQIYNDILKAMEITQHLYFPSDLKFQMMQFFAHLRHRPPEVSLQGYLTADRRFMSELIPAVVSNVIILVQFNTRHKTYDAAYFSRIADYITYSGSYKLDN